MVIPTHYGTSIVIDGGQIITPRFDSLEKMENMDEEPSPKAPNSVDSTGNINSIFWYMSISTT